MAINPLDPANAPVSLDDLLKANRQQFEQIFSRQQQSLDALNVNQRPPPPQDSNSASDAAGPVPRPHSAKAGESAARPPPPLMPQPRAPVASATRDTPGYRKLNPVSLNLIAHALDNICREMTALLQCRAASVLMREQAATAAMITDGSGLMLAGHSDCYIAAMLAQQQFDLQPGDVLLHSDPYLANGTVGRVGDWLVLLPVFYADEPIGFSVMSGPVTDAGGSWPDSAAAAATSIFSEGIRIPPVKIYQHGELNQALLDVILNNTRTAQHNSQDLMALIAGCRRGEQRLLELCRRFGSSFYRQSAHALLERSRHLLAGVIRQQLPQEPQTFEDYIDDDGYGNGPFKLKLSLWREDDHAYFDWTGTSPQAAGPINCLLHEGLFKRFIVRYLAARGLPFPVNDGGYPLIHVNMPQGSLLQPQFPAALAHGSTTLARQFDVLNGALSKTAAQLSTAAGYGAGAYFAYHGSDRSGRRFQFSERLAEGMPGRPAGDGIDAHGCRPADAAVAVEVLEKDYPIVIERYCSITDSGGAGRHRGGNGVEKIYLLLAAGAISLHDDRQLTAPWGILGGKAGSCSQKWLIREDGSREALPAKIDHVKVQSGDRIVFRSAGGGGWGDPLQRDVQRVRNDVARALITAAAARDAYGVILSGADTITIDQRATRDLRERLQRDRDGRAPARYDFGERPGQPPHSQQ